MALKSAPERECGSAMGLSSSSLAVKAFQLSVAAARDPPAIDYWDYLEHIEAPQWVDLSLEAALEGTEGDNPWFYQHHPHHETPLEELVFTPARDTTKERKVLPEQDFSTSSSDHKTDLESSQEREKRENGRLRSTKAKRVPVRETSNEVVKDAKEEKSEKRLSSSSESFSTKLLSTLMARLRANGEMQTATTFDTNLEDSSLSNSKAMNQMETPAVNIPGQTSVLHIRRSIACVPLETRTNASSSKPAKKAFESFSRGNKENSNAPTPGKPQRNQVKKPKLMNARKSLTTFEFNKNAFSVGRSDGGFAIRRRLSCTSKSPRLKNGKAPSRVRSSNERKSVKTVRVTTAAKEPKSSREARAGDEALAALIAKHNSKFLPKPKYEPRLHSTRDIRQWERRTGQQYYSLQPIERVKVNQEITDFKRSKVL